MKYRTGRDHVIHNHLSLPMAPLTLLPSAGVTLESLGFRFRLTESRRRDVPSDVDVVHDPPRARRVLANQPVWKLQRFAHDEIQTHTKNQVKNGKVTL